MSKIQYIGLVLFILIKSDLHGQEVIRYGVDIDSAQIDTIVMPEYPGGEDEFFHFLENRLSMGNTRNILNGIGDIVRFTFTVDKDGKVNNIHLNSSTNPGLIYPFQEALGMMEDWKPGSKNGKPKKFNMYYTLRIRSIPQIPYVEIIKEQHVPPKTKTSNSLKWFLGAGTVLVFVLFVFLK